jgi:hypothetical protein
MCCPFLKYLWRQIELNYTECIHMCDVGDSVSKQINQQTICYLNISTDHIPKYLWEKSVEISSGENSEQED